ncbi:MAG: glypican [Cyanobium sp.]|nr:glypican [Cyanobacteriota bacterium]
MNISPLPPVIRLPSSWALNIPSLPAGLLLVATALGAMLLASFILVTLVPLVLILGGIATSIVVMLLLGWASIEGLAAFERWMEQDPRFQR